MFRIIHVIHHKTHLRVFKHFREPVQICQFLIRFQAGEVEFDEN